MKINNKLLGKKIKSNQKFLLDEYSSFFSYLEKFYFQMSKTTSFFCCLEAK